MEMIYYTEKSHVCFTWLPVKQKLKAKSTARCQERNRQGASMLPRHCQFDSCARSLGIASLKCTLNPFTEERQTLLDQISRMVLRSRKIWRGRDILCNSILVAVFSCNRKLTSSVLSQWLYGTSNPIRIWVARGTYNRVTRVAQVSRYTAIVAYF